SATGMNAAAAGIFSSARSRLAIVLFLPGPAVGRLLDLARRSGLELLAAPLRGGDSVLDRLADRVIGVGHDVARALRGVLSPLHRLARAELDGLAAEIVDLATAWARRDVSARDQTDHAAEQKPAESAA